MEEERIKNFTRFYLDPDEEDDEEITAELEDAGIDADILRGKILALIIKQRAGSGEKEVVDSR